MTKTQKELVLEYYKQMREDAEEYARQKTDEAGKATRRAAELEALCAKLEEEMNGKTRD